MNNYKIQYKGSTYVTDADNMLEAENKFVEEYFDDITYDDEKVSVTEVDDIEELRNDSNINFF